MCGVSVLCIAATGGRVGGMGVCVWRPPVGAGAETEAERHSQAKDNAVCVLGGRGGGGGGGWCVAGVNESFYFLFFLALTLPSSRSLKWAFKCDLLSFT